MTDKLSPSTGRGDGRIVSIDLLRGIVMILMLLDHVRTFWNGGTGIDPTDVSGTYPALFFTRWITHLCAPAFLLLSGTSARLALIARKASRREACVSLCRRGIALILMELTVVSICWGYAFFYNGVFLQVIWVIGVSQIFLGLLQFIPPTATGALGLAMIAAHNLLPEYDFSGTAAKIVWNVIHEPGVIPVFGSWKVEVLYPLVPWIGVAAFGYSLGDLYALEPRSRKLMLTTTGAAFTVLFFILRTINGYGDPERFTAYESPIRTVFSFLNVEKYPPSLLFILATVGPALLLLSFLERFHPGERNPLVVFGRTPLFFYIVHLVLLILVSIAAVLLFNAVGIMRGFSIDGPFGYPLAVTYVLWPAFLLAMYVLCRKYAAVKFTKKYGWTKYL